MELTAKQINKYKDKSVSKLVQIAQTHFNAYIRKRDADLGRFLCISCHKWKPLSELQAGHYFPAGHYTALRFDEDNVNGQCRSDNYFKHGNQVGYRRGLINKIGLERVEMLEARANRSRSYKWSRLELISIIEQYKQKIKEL